MNRGNRNGARPNQPPRNAARNAPTGGPLRPLPEVRGGANRNVTFAEACGKFKVPVPKKNTNLINALSTQGLSLPLFLTNDVNNNSHPIGAAVRTYATVSAYADMYKCGATSCLSICGVDRDRIILNKILDMTDENNRNFNLYIYRPLIVAKDIYRCHNNYLDCALPLVPQGVDAIFMLDVYDHMNGNLGPEEIMDYCRMYIGERQTISLWWVGFSFLKPYGIGFDQGAWKRLENGRVQFFVDDALGNSYEHSACDWIWTNNVYRANERESLSWTIVQNWGAKYYMVRFTYGKDPIYVSAPLNPPSGWTEVEIDEPMLSKNSIFMNQLFPITRFCVNYVPSLVHYILGKKKVLVPTDLYELLKSQDFLKEKTRLSMQQMKTRAIDYMRDSSQMGLLLKYFPADFAVFIPNTVIAIFYENVAFESKIGLLRRDIYGESLEQVNANLAQFNKASDYGNVNSKWFAAAAGLTLCYAGFKVGRMYDTPIFGNVLKSMLSVCSKPLRVLFSLLGSIPSYTPVIDDFHHGIATVENEFLDHFQKVSIIELGVLAPVIEEAIKRIPWIGWLFGPLEFARKLAYGVPFAAAAPTVVMHEITRRLPYGWGVFGHAFWNLSVYWIAAQFNQVMFPGPALAGCLLGFYCCKNFMAHPAAEFMQQMYHSPNAFEWVSPNRVFSDNYPSEMSMIPTVNGVVEKVKPTCPLMKVKSKHVEMGREPDTYWYCFLANPVPLRVPKRSDFNLMLVVTHRVLAAAPLDPVVQKTRWKKLPDVVPYVTEPLIWKELVEPWIDHFEEGMKKKRYLDALSQYERQGDCYLSMGYNWTEVMVKTDEALCKMEADGRVLLKPRCIANVHPSVQLDLGPILYGATDRFKTYWCPFNPYTLKYRKKKFFLSYAGASTDRDLSEWWLLAQHVEMDEYYVMVSGDDSIIVTRDCLGLKIFLGDFGMFDQSQSFGPLKYERRQLFRLGVSPYYLEKLKIMSSLPYRVVFKNMISKLSIDRSCRPIRDTGGPDTSIGNSINNAAAWVYSLSLSAQQPIEKTMQELGLDLKLKIVRNIEDADFLKGTWYPVQHDRYDHYWGPLPSRLLKVGKSLRDPRTLYQGSYEQAAEQFLNDLACGYSSYLEVPLLRVFIRTFHKREKLRNLIEIYKITASPEPKPPLLPGAFDMLARRYKVELLDLQEFEASYPKEIFSYHCHPLYERMAMVDYS